MDTGKEVRESNKREKLDCEVKKIRIIVCNCFWDILAIKTLKKIRGKEKGERKE